MFNRVIIKTNQMLSKLSPLIDPDVELIPTMDGWTISLLDLEKHVDNQHTIFHGLNGGIVYKKTSKYN
jgi:ketopantoate reductase